MSNETYCSLPPNVWQRNLYTFVPPEDNYETESWDMQQLDTYPTSQPSKQLKTNELRSCMPTGWHFGAWIATFQAGVVLLINIITLLVCVGKTSGSIGIAQIFEGDCNTVDHVTLGIHFVINVLSTLLLSASNYVMQSLSAPTRTEVDRAHKKGFWLDIGSQSMHNLKHTSGWKRLLWTLLSISSIPLHLFYNSAFFSTISANDYNWYLAQGPEMRDLPQNNLTFNWDCADLELVACSSPDAEPANWLDSPNCLRTYACLGPDIEPANWEFLNPSDCLHAYAVDFLASRRDLVMVVGDYIPNNSFLILQNSISGQMSTPFTPYDWICGSTSSIPAVPGSCSQKWREINPSNWTMQAGPFLDTASIATGSLGVQYCLSETTASKCQLQFNLPLLAIVVAFNLVKVICMVIVATKMHDNPLVTLGDAIASFTNNPEPLTKDMCLVSQSYLERIILSGDKNELGTRSFLIAYQPQQTTWMATASRRHWITICSLLASAKLHLKNIITSWRIPSHGYWAILASVLIANLPQLIFSMIYLVFNGLCTKLFLALEWSSYAQSRKPLRVSDPHGDQRSTYFLNIPFRFGVPLMVYSALLHWLLSQSIFVVAVTFWNGDVIDTSSSLTTCGYSPAAMFLTTVVGASLILSSLAAGYFKHLRCDMPLAGSCSKAIAAACHPPEDGSDPLKPMKWGVISNISDSSNPAVGHISFSSGEVSAPVPGCYYL
ncbi:hypothetical protein BDP27DRAFT_1428743 [Rhodocollybia butyracea]|uniref:DUF6536 domain-containing protein n=1 Tax=Rhodocollybia butyracea TaxID=206335 RepID=A0A9P5U0P5_9AGAR|nr:hypothetical protein BDP27DRAFT_1428743 [Rhodocollybia butyracea]